MKKKKANNFKILWHYLKSDRLLLIIYIIIVLISYLPGVIAPLCWAEALKNLMANNFFNFFIFVGLSEGLYIVLWSLFSLPRQKIYNYLEIKFIKNVSMDLYKKIDSLPARAFEDIGVGEYINRLYTDPDRVMDLVSSLIRLICKSFTCIAIFALAFSVSFILGIELVIFSLIMGITSTVYLPKIKAKQEEIKKQSDEYVKTATENISGIREIKSLGIKNNIEKDIFKKLNALFISENNRRNYEMYYSVFNDTAYFSLKLVIMVTAGYFAIHGYFAYSIVVMIESYLGRIDSVVESISDFGVNYNKVQVSLKRIDEIINNKLYEDELFGNKDLININGNIRFDHVIFKYRDEEDTTLKDLNMVIEPRKKIAIVGRSGNGKSTIFNLLLRYFDATAGHIYIDDTDIKDLTEKALRKNISIIRQSPFLFNMSILNNFKIVKENVTLEEIRQVCKEAYIDDYIMRLPNQYDTIIGEGGINLSGGQKQRLAIARTLLLNTKIILFDEATSALDNESQDYIKKTIDNLVKNHTVIIVAHRLSTIIDADIINVINEGQLVASGTHQELLNSCDVYQKLYINEGSNS